METESKYLKKIRDVLRKKNSGSSSGTIYSGPNTKAKYLNDIAKEVDKLDISGGGSSESPIYIINAIQDHGDYYADKTNEEILATYNANKVLYLKSGIFLDRFDKAERSNGQVTQWKFVRQIIKAGEDHYDPTKPAVVLVNAISVINVSSNMSISNLTETTVFGC